MLFADLVATSAAVTSTRSRSAKVAALADLLGRLNADEVVIVDLPPDDLLQLRRVRPDLGEAALILADHRDPVPPRLALEEGHGLLHRPVQVGRGALRRGGAGEAEQPAGDRRTV